MERRRLLAGVAAAGFAIGAPGTAIGAPPRRGPVLDAPPRRGPVLEYGQDGGFVPPGWDELRAPELVVYPDRTAIADARHRLRLGTIDRLLRRAAAVVADPANGTLTLGPDDPQIADAPHTYFTVRGRTLRVYALETYREFDGYPEATYALHDALEKEAARVRMHGEPYRPDAIKLVAVIADGSAPDGVRPWPAHIPAPVIAEGRWWVTENRHGAAARAVIRLLPHHDPARWRQYRMPSGRVLSLSYRRLLPHEGQRAA